MNRLYDYTNVFADKKPYVSMEDWSICQTNSGYDPSVESFLMQNKPNQQLNLHLSGIVFGHDHISDGRRVVTTSIKDVKCYDSYMIVTTKNTRYLLFYRNMSSEYEQRFPNAKNILREHGSPKMIQEREMQDYVR